MRKALVLSVLLLIGCSDYKTTQITLPDGFIVHAQIADTPKKQELGLMFRESLPANSGMLFTFTDEQPRMFWMKNTFIPLDILFLDKARTITGISRDVPRSYKTTPQTQVAQAGGYGMYVLELPAGTSAKHKLQEGQILDFKL